MTTLNKAKIYQTNNGRVYFSMRDKKWWYVPEGNFLTAWNNMRHTSSDRAVCERAEGQLELSETQALREIRG